MRKKFFCNWRCVSALASLTCLGSIEVARAADLESFGFVKVANSIQTDAATVTPDTTRAFEVVLFAVPTDFSAINFIQVSRPSGTPIPLTEETDYTFRDSRSSQAQLNSAYGPGTYTFTFDTANDDTTLALLNVPADAYPIAPLVLNFSALQSANATMGFDVQWQPFAGGNATDRIQLRIVDNNFAVFESDIFGPLNGTATSVAVLGGFLEAGKTYKGFLKFSKVMSADTTSYPGATGTSEFASETQFSIKTTAGGGTAGPSLLFANPADGATDVPISSPVVFVFSTPMQPVQAIAWSDNNVNAANFQYSWPQPDTLLVTYARGLPGNTRIGYTLNGFKDSTGAPMTPVSGGFTTGAGSTNPDPCLPNPDDPKGGLSVFKNVTLVQTGPGMPVPKAAGAFSVAFVATLQSPANNPVVSATLKLPNGQTVTIPNTFGRLFSFFKDFPDEFAMDAEFPSGNYVATIRRTDNTTQTLTVAIGQEPPAPHLANWNEANTLNAGADFALRWDAFTGAVQNDSILLNMHDQAGQNFTAPDPCVPRELANTASSIVIPRNTFALTGEIDGSLTFSKGGAQDTSISDLSGSAGYSKTTEFKLRSQPVTGTALRFNQPVLVGSGPIQIGVTGTASSRHRVEVSTDLKAWNTLSTLTLSASGTGEVMLPRSGPHTFLRARSTQ